MALNATMYRFSLDLSDMDRGIYTSATAHIALHPSETLERMAMRFFAYCLNYTESLEFTKGLSTDNEPDLWQKSLSDELEMWIELGLPDAKRIKKACNQSEKVRVYAYGGQGVENWLQSNRKELIRHSNLEMFRFDDELITQFSDQIERTMSLACMIQDGQVNVSWNDQMLDIAVTPIPLEVF